MINSIEINGYRLLDAFRADIGQLTVVIGANATGKSTLINFFQLVSRSVEFSLRDVLGWEGGLGSVLTALGRVKELGWAVTFQKPVAHRILANIPLKDDRSYVYEVRIDRGPYGEPVPDYEVVRSEKPYGGHEEPFKLLEATRQRSLIFNYSMGRLVPFDEAFGDRDHLPLYEGLESENKQGQESDLTKRAQVAEEGRTLRLAQMRFFNEYPVLSWIRLLLASCRSYPGFDVVAGSNLRSKPADIKVETRLLPNGENLGTVLHEMLTRADYMSSANELREFLRVAYPSFIDIFAETAWGTPARVLLSVREKGMIRSMQLWDLSDGMLRFLCLGAALLNPVPPVFIAIDEPETGLHPKLLPIVADMIKSASEETQVLVTTHSPDLLNCFDVDNVAVMVRDENEINWQRPSNRASLKKMLETVVGDSLGDLHRSGELEAL